MTVTITGMGIRCPLADDVPAFDRALRAGRSGITFADPGPGLPRTLGFRGRLPRTPEPKHADAADHERVAPLTRRASRSVRYALLAAAEAYRHAGLDAVRDRRRIALVVAGSNLTLQLTAAMSEKHRKDPAYVSPRYAHQLWDSDLIGVVSEAFGIRGECMTVGGASAAGNLGIIQATRLIRAGAADRCLVVAGMQELSDVELAAFANLGALGGGRENATPATSCLPFDTRHDGFVYAESAAALVLERAADDDRALAHVEAGASALDGHHLTQPSQEGEEFVMREVLARAGVTPGDVGLVSAHATGTPLGDDTEAAAIEAVFGPGGDAAGGAARGRPWVNATKSLVGHSLGAAGAVEAIACVLQLRGGYVHPNPHLAHPANPRLRYAPTTAVPAAGAAGAAPGGYALSNSFAFGGINTSLLLRSLTRLTRKD